MNPWEYMAFVAFAGFILGVLVGIIAGAYLMAWPERKTRR